MIAATTQTTITALRGWPECTRETHEEKGRTPSRATAKTRREAAVIATAVFCSFLVWVIQVVGEGTYQPQGEDADDVHKDMSTTAKHHSVQWNKWLRRAKRE